jgi:hypothetical protein
MDGSYQSGAVLLAEPMAVQPPCNHKSVDQEPLLEYPIEMQPSAVPANFVDVPATLEHVEGVMVRQKLFLSEVLLNFCERRNRYTIAPWSPRNSKEPNDDEFLAMGTLLHTREESTCLCRYACKNFREMRLGFFPPTIPAGQGYPSGHLPMMEIHRPFRCTIPCCCCIINPQQMFVTASNHRTLGMAEQDWRCLEAMCCSQYVKVFDSDRKPIYVTKWNPCCCSADTSNCFAPSCCNRVFTIPVYNAEETEIVAQIENVWPGWNFRGVCGAGFSNWVLKFPEDSTGDQKSLLLAALFLQEFMHFERNAEK